MKQSTSRFVDRGPDYFTAGRGMGSYAYIEPGAMRTPKLVVALVAALVAVLAYFI